ncbi:nitric oxide reductase activation protein NorD [Methylogaea oryzae]|uniref:nitric oxide reductase activation protein NorD n=1 Tax=Methylogaea oryzae TaxID=1295382 RepID=UPI000A6D3C59|nr:VWA domain-containing protein [Methylogaea oryzae]
MPPLTPTLSRGKREPLIRGIDRYRALLAHLSAHRLWSRPFIADNYNRYQQIFIEVFEDARVEHLAMARYPGLRRLWQALHPIPKEGACPADHSPIRHLAAMLSRALLDPGHPYTDPVLLEFVQRFHQRMAAAPHDTAIATDLGVEYLVRTHNETFRYPKVYFTDTEASYRDDNRYLWIFLEDTEEEDDFHSDHAAANPKAEEDRQPAGLARHHPEWDREAQYYRPDWVTVYESLQTAGEAGAIDRLLDKHSPLLKRLKRVVDLIKPQQHARVRYQEEGSELDLDVAIRAVIDYKSGGTPDPRIHYSHKHDGRDFAVMLLLDLSQSVNETPAGCRSSILQLSQEAVSLLAEAVSAMGDPLAIAGFASNTRHEVRYFHFKGFGEPWDDTVKARLAGMQGALSTRMGAALRHAGHYLAARSAGKKLLLLLSDGEPADIDVEDPAYLCADARKAVEELSMRGIASYCITLDPLADQYVADIFGRNNYTVVDRIQRLPERLRSCFCPSPSETGAPSRRTAWLGRPSGLFRSGDSTTITAFPHHCAAGPLEGEGLEKPSLRFGGASTPRHERRAKPAS